jgi:phage tail tape-measure protein
MEDLMKAAVWVAAVGSVALLVGSGTSQKERTTGGAAAGAATGAGVGALGGPPGVVVGALVGGAAGAATGAATTPNELNLGKPPWNNPQTRVAGHSTSSRRTYSRTATSQNAAVERLNQQSLNAAQQGNNYDQWR